MMPAPSSSLLCCPSWLRPSLPPLQAENNSGIKLTESMAMLPASSVSALVFAHPNAEYFAVGKIEKDQVASYAERKGWTMSEAEQWLRPILAYDSEVQVGGGGGGSN